MKNATKTAKRTAAQAEPELGNAKGVALVSGTTGKVLEAMDAVASKTMNAKKPAAKATKPSAGKGATILAMITRKGGATATELQNATGWQAHSVRGFLSAASKKGLAKKLASVRREDGQRVYTAKA